MAAATGGTAGVRRDKLGLALSGGGFRASLFHLGVLRRMAELDILRDVEVLSTVSGGSITGALYMLFLKKEIDARGQLSRADYLAIVDKVQESLVRSIQLNLRQLLFMNPLGILRMLLTEHSMGRRMSRLYERYLYREPVRLLDLHPTFPMSLWRPGYLRLRDVWFHPAGDSVKSIDRYNTTSATKLPSLILNATSLNSGRSFRFSAAEIGDSRLGLFRWDDIETELEPRKRLLELSQGAFDEEAASHAREPLRTLYTYARWWRELKLDTHAPAPFRLPLLPGTLLEAELGALRRAKIAAWYVLHGPAYGLIAPGGPEYDDWLERFWRALRRIDPYLTGELWDAVAYDPHNLDEILECVLQLYYLRSAQAMSPRLKDDYKTLALSEAVGASACFPPVFPPFIILGIYDDTYVSRLALTDGGVYDNVGTRTLLEEECNYIIASDTGALMELEERASGGRLGLAGRIPGILMERVGDLQNQGLEDRRELTALGTAGDGLYGLTYFHIESRPIPGPGCTTGLDVKMLGRIRTDLDAFGDVEVAALVNHGYDVADRHIRAKLGHSPFVHDPTLWVAPTAVPMTLPAPPRAREIRILQIGQSRFFRSLMLGAVVSWLFVAALAAGVWYLTRDAEISVSNVMVEVAEWATDSIADLVPVVGAVLVHEPVPVFIAIVVLVVIVCVILAWSSLIKRLQGKHRVNARRLAFAAKWIRSYIMNLIWLVGLAPIWIALGVATAAWAVYVFFNWPFLRKTRVR